MAEVRGFARQIPLKVLHAAKGLKIWILPPFFHNALVTQIPKLPEQEQSHHETNGLCGPTAFGIERREPGFQPLPRDSCSQKQERIPGIELVDEIRIEKSGLVNFGAGLAFMSKSEVD